MQQTRILFAAFVLAVAGIMRIFDAIWAFTYDGPIPANLQDALFGHTLDTYGWIFLIVGLALIGCSILVLKITSGRSMQQSLLTVLTGATLTSMIVGRGDRTSV